MKKFLVFGFLSGLAGGFYLIVISRSVPSVSTDIQHSESKEATSQIAGFSNTRRGLASALAEAPLRNDGATLDPNDSSEVFLNSLARLSAGQIPAAVEKQLDSIALSNRNERLRILSWVRDNAQLSQGDQGRLLLNELKLQAERGGRMDSAEARRDLTLVFELYRSVVPNPVEGEAVFHSLYPNELQDHLMTSPAGDEAVIRPIERENLRELNGSGEAPVTPSE